MNPKTLAGSIDFLSAAPARLYVKSFIAVANGKHTVINQVKETSKVLESLGQLGQHACITNTTASVEGLTFCLLFVGVTSIQRTKIYSSGSLVTHSPRLLMRLPLQIIHLILLSFNQ